MMYSITGRDIWSRFIACLLVCAVDEGLLPNNESFAQHAEPNALVETPIDDSDREHWSFARLVRPAPPQVQNTEWIQNEIDCFVLRQLEEQGLQPAPPVARDQLLRRIKFDLIGLPPTIEELHDFRQDQSPAACERMIDRLLASPGYGERWGQHWLDLARFAETDGFEHDKLRPQAWEYRQWVVDALNSDMPYDRFITLQIAGDLLEPDRHGVATSFCLAGPDMPDINEQDLRRHDKLNEITATVGSALLGLQMGCAQCHDHKYDPISQADFYRLRAIFEPAVPLLKRDKPVARLAAQADSAPARFYARGELSGLGPIVQPAPPRIACSAQAWSSLEGRNDPRLAFAAWMFRPDNPLVARVIANRIWQHHFGTSLCGNPSDLGVVASEPTHPALLDWLAAELQASQWSIKTLHRKILLSATYRQAGSCVELQASQRESFRNCIEFDPRNQLYGRFPRIRLEGEVIRDAMLAVAGLLNREYGGPSIMPPLPDEMKQTLLTGQWQESLDVDQHSRRSIYIFARRNLRYPIFEVFDRPDAGATCPQCSHSTTALQALHMLNSELAVSSARALSQRMLRETESQTFDAVLDRLFETTYSRRPSDDERQWIQESFRVNAKQADAFELEERLFVVCLAMLNANEFIYVD